MLSEIINGGTLVWYCQAREFQDDLPCNILNIASLDDAVYKEAPNSTFGKGAVIALPHCACGAQTFLKADWSLKELYRVLIAFQDEQGHTWGYGLRFGHVYSLQVHWMLYQQGKAAYPPVIDMPPQRVMEHSQFEEVDPRVVCALWYGFTVVRQLMPEALDAGHMFAQIASPVN